MMKIRIRPSFFAYICMIALLSELTAAAAALSALFVHELGHYIVSRICGENLDSLELTPFGGVMHYTYVKSSSKGIRGIAVAAAGPAANYMMLLACCTSPIQCILGIEMTEKMVIAHSSMLLLNLIPALPLDGGRIVFCLGYYLFSVSSLIKVLCIFGCLTGMAMTAAAIYGLASSGILNCSLIIVGVYLVCCAWRSRDVMTSENMYAVIQERMTAMPFGRKLEFFTVEKSRQLYELLPLIERTQAAVFLWEWNDKYCFIPERRVLQMMMEHPEWPISSLEAN